MLPVVCNTLYCTNVLNVQNHDVVLQKNTVTLQQYDDIKMKCRLAVLCRYV